MRHFVYKNSNFQEIDEKKFTAHELAGQTGVFETLRVYDGKVFLLEAHLRRFYSGANNLKFTTPPVPPMNELQRVLAELLAKFSNARVLRFLAAKSYDQMVFSIDDKDRYSHSQYEEGMKLLVNSIDGISRDAARKELDLMGLLRFKENAKDSGFDDSILLSGGNLVTDTSVANIFWSKDGKVYTPSPDVCLLNGVTRRFILKMAPKIGLTISEGQYSLEQLIEADEVFLSNSVMEIMPVTLITGEKEVGFAIGPATRKLMAFYYAVRSKQAAMPQPDSSSKFLRSLLDR